MTTPTPEPLTAADLRREYERLIAEGADPADLLPPPLDPAPAGLDVERLARALNKARHGGPCGHPGLTCDELAGRVAAAYARLGSAAEEEG